MYFWQNTEHKLQIIKVPFRLTQGTNQQKVDNYIIVSA